MRKFITIFGSLFIFLVCFFYFKNDSLASTIEYHTYTVQGSITVNPGDQYWTADINIIGSEYIYLYVSQGNVYVSCERYADIGAIGDEYPIFDIYYTNVHAGSSGVPPVNGAQITYSTENWFTYVCPYDWVVSTSIPLFRTLSGAYDYIRHGDTSGLDNKSPSIAPHVSSVEPSTSIPAPHVHWGTEDVIYNNKTYTVFNHSLYFDNYVYDTVDHSKYFLEMTAEFSSVRGGSISDSHNNSSFLFNYDENDIVFGPRFNLGFTKPSVNNNINNFKTCPGVIHFGGTQGDANDEFATFLSNFPINSSQFSVPFNVPLGSLFYSNNNLGNIDFAFNCPLVVCRYYLVDDNGVVTYGPWTSTSLKMPDPGSHCVNTDYTQGRLSVFNNFSSTSSEPVPDPFPITTPNPDPNPNPIPDPSPNPTPVPGTDDIDLTELRSTLNTFFDYIKSVPQFFRQLFLFLPTWVTSLIAVCLALLVIIGVVKLIF